MAEEQQAKLNFNGIEYTIADLSDDAKAQIQNLRVAEAELKHLNAQLAITQTAINAYKQALQKALPDTSKH